MSKLNIKLRDSLGRFKKIDLIDSQNRGARIFRRVFFLVSVYAVVALLGMLFVDKPKYEEYVREIDEVEAVEVVEDTTKWIDGDRVTEKADGTTEVVPAEVFRSASPEGIENFVLNEYPGSRIDKEYLNLLEDNCSEEALRVVIGISVAETSMGKNTDKQSNFFGWFKGGNRNYDPSREVMAKEICEGVKKSYMKIGKDGSVTSTYTGGDRTSNWSKNFNWAIDQMR